MCVCLCLYVCLTKDTMFNQLLIKQPNTVETVYCTSNQNVLIIFIVGETHK